jgi:hypothetical protein
LVNRKRQKQNQILFKTIVDFTTQIIYFLGMKKLKIDPNKIIRVKPRMIKEGPDVAPLFTIILGFLLGIVFMSLVSCEEQKSQKEEPIGLRQKSDDRHKNVTEFTYGGCEYIRVGYGQSAWGSHKGNCINPIHKK